MTATELAQMVQIMRRDQDAYRQHMTQAARIKADYGERAVDKAVAKILADAESENDKLLLPQGGSVTAPPSWAWEKK